MKTIAIFNNKGGVGKTTFCANIATHFAMTHKKRVLVLDLDPQANITHYMLGAEMAGSVVAPYYDRTIPKVHNSIVDAFDRYELGESVINTDIKEIYCERFETSLIAGNPFLASFEDILSKKWNELSDPDMVGGIRISNWIHTLLQSKSEDYDYAFIDLSPSIGALNRTALLAADYFIAPMSCDIFSLVAIKNIKIWFDKWVSYYNEKYKIFAKEKGHILAQIPGEIKAGVNIDQGFLGYTLQSYISRKDAAGNVRTTDSYQRIIDNFEPEIERHLSPFKMPSVTKNADLNLGEIPHMFGILALSQYVAAPITNLNASDGMAGSQYAQAKNYVLAFNVITEKIMKNLGEPLNVA
ncbi:ParA family protein [Massilia sp. R2A-15]|uniref:ParA family protein n=1 Tax=Massilia sp. R2A-15 TaxID=3064278 RepID=UPI0027361256|nr:ParA family protein [Massilia sp. R2A-15]WLI89025.1 ParA family protein [Massilia sp. R2A-15]